jgi:signal transduction histidine kinase
VHKGHPVILLNLPAGLRQRRLIFVMAVVLLGAFALAAPFATTPMRRLDAFIPTLEAIIFVNDLITSVLLFAQYAIFPSRAMLMLASGYLFTALIVIPHALTFPGAFTPGGLLGAGLQSTGWLYYFWHVGFPSAVLAYALLKGAAPRNNAEKVTTARAIGLSVAIVLALVCALTWAVTAGDQYLPTFFSDRTKHVRDILNVAIPVMLVVSGIALAALWIRRVSVLDYWLMLVIWSLILEEILIALLSDARFSFGFYAGRVFSLITSLIVLVLLLAETTKLHARLARSYQLLESERESKLMNIDAVAASIAHEVRQPLTAIASSGNAALRFLDGVSPDIQRARSLLRKMTDESYRASEVLESIRTLFREDDRERRAIDLNELSLEVLQLLRVEINDHGVTVRTDLAIELPAVEGHRNQLRQVLINLVLNALEAMDATKEGSRVLFVKTGRQTRDSVIVAVEDSGPGIESKRLEGIFDAFVTTKTHGMGLGLAISRTIIESHGGQLSASSDGVNGARFQLVLPTQHSDATTAPLA